MQTWGTDAVGISAIDAIEFYMSMPQTLFTAMVTGQDGYVKPNISWDIGLLDQNGNELTGNGYGRVNVNFSKGNFVTSGLNTVQNGIVIAYGSASPSAWVTAYTLGFYDLATGKLLQSAPLNNPMTVTAGNNLQFGPNALSLFVPI